MIQLALVAILSAEPAWEKVGETDGVTIEQRPVAGSQFVELRFSLITDKTPKSLCDAAFGDGKFDPQEPDLKARTVLSEAADERVTYEEITPPVVSNRDYVVRARRSWEGPACRMTFEALNEGGPRPKDGWVRITKVRGFWLFEPTDNGKTRLTYVVFSDPAGSIPPFLVEGNRRKLGVRWVKMIDSRGKAP
ncbi:MAG: START domain-containing protein [Myxococcaceae bacterium]|nr:START domain-containing protein [Myxococcaceae bacterium]